GVPPVKTAAATPHTEVDLSLAFGKLFRQALGLVDKAERRDDRPCIDGDGPGHAVVVGEVKHQRLDVAVEDQADDLVGPVDDRAARVPADDVGRGDEVHRRVEGELA